jgi:hypothetical protein
MTKRGFHLPFAMQKILTTLLICSISMGLFAQDFKWSLYPSLGIDMGGAVPFPFSDIPDGAGGTPKLNPLLGVGFEYNVYPRWNLSLELNYHNLEFSAKAKVISQSINNGALFFSGDTKTDVELRQIEFPLLSRWKARENWSLLFGIYYSRILEGAFISQGSSGVLSADKEDTDNAVLPGTADMVSDYSWALDKYDYGVLLGYRYNLNHRLFFWGRFHFGFKSIFQKDFEVIEYEMYQLRLSIGASYSLFYDNKRELRK